MVLPLVLLWTVTFTRSAMLWRSGSEVVLGMLAPVLAYFILRNRWKSRPNKSRDAGSTFWSASVIAAAIAWTTTNLLLVRPEQPGAIWLLYVSAGACTTAALGARGGRSWARHLFFPFVLVLTALPLPAIVRHGLIEHVVTTVTGIGATCMSGLAGATNNGNAIGFTEGTLGVSEVCSGLKALEAALLVTLFVGEIFRLGFARRIALVCLAIVFVFAGSAARITVAASLAAQDASDAVGGGLDGVRCLPLIVAVVSVLVVGWTWRGRRELRVER